MSSSAPPASSVSTSPGPSFVQFDRAQDFGPGRNHQLTKAQAEISGRRKLLRPKSPDENSSGRSLWKVFLNFFAPPSPSPSNKTGWAYTVNCSGIIYNNIIILGIFLSIFSRIGPQSFTSPKILNRCRISAPVWLKDTTSNYI